MPYIHCERCRTSCYSNVLSCPRCKAPVDRAYAHAMVSDWDSRVNWEAEDTETEVRAALYSWHSGCVSIREVNA
jgi:hypothetical protein